MPHPRVVIRSALPGLVWPAVTAPDVATALALQYQLARSQWLPRGELDALQSRQLGALVDHAWRTVPFYRWRWQGSHAPGEDLSRPRFEGLPLLGRDDLVREFDALKSDAPPAAHGAIVESRAARADGAPVRMLTTALAGLWQQVLTLRDHLWHARDFDGKLAVLRAGAQVGEEAGWGAASSMVESAGRVAVRDARAAVAEQLEWLRRYDPDYLLAEPSIAAALARLAIGRGIRLPRLREVRTFGERPGPDTRRLCREAWNVPLTDAYECDEAGVLALQCPDHEHYHVQSECVLVEVLDEHGRACAPGAVGRVVVTTLQNFAMPLVRYATGDHAEVGAACACGRGLPVLRRIDRGRAAAPA